MDDDTITDLKQFIATTVRQETAELETRLGGRIDQLNRKIDQKIDHLDKKLSTKIDDLSKSVAEAMDANTEATERSCMTTNNVLSYWNRNSPPKCSLITC